MGFFSARSQQLSILGTVSEGTFATGVTLTSLSYIFFAAAGNRPCACNAADRDVLASMRSMSLYELRPYRSESHDLLTERLCLRRFRSALGNLWVVAERLTREMIHK